MQIIIAWEGDHIGLIAPWIRHEPHPHFCHYAVVGLRKYTVVVWTESYRQIRVSELIP
jgi:hypothetical protein